MTGDAYYISHILKDHHRHQLLDLFKCHWWLKARTLEDIKAIESACLIFALIERATDKLMGFSRVLTDNVKYAYVHDVIVQDELQGKGFGRLLMDAMLTHSQLEKMVCFELTCTPDKIPFYAKFNFKEDYGPVRPLRYDKRPISPEETRGE